MEEIKQKMWRRWRQNKGKKVNYPRMEKEEPTDLENWKTKLQKIEEEIKNYETELEEAKKEQSKKLERTKFFHTIQILRVEIGI